MEWLWAVVIVACAAILTFGLYFIANHKKFIKKREKKPKKIKTPKSKEVKPETPPPTKPEYEFSLEEKRVQPVEKQADAGQGYVPSQDFVPRMTEYSEMATSPMPRRRRPVIQQAPPPPIHPIDDFEKFRREHGYSASIKEQIQNLSPEMKAILFGNVLDKKDDQF